ncbi:transcription factor [Castilleja foliolosa]|uniref:Transcription factor n=1 Tax=Castilleja foliolosa TaxID=1961234 RepID=A0ABD3BFR6_9LAMI
MPKKTVIDGGIYMGALFYALIVAMFNGLSELALSILKLPVFFKQRDLLFFPPWAYSLPTWILKIPITLLEVSVWTVITYYTTGYDSDAARFFKQWLLLICINQMASGLFRLMGALGRNIIVANTFGSCALLMVLALGGFILSRDNIQKWWILGYWLSPLMYGQNAVAVNEFLGKSWSYVLPGSTEPIGVTILRSRGMFPEARWYWIGVGAVVGYVVLFNFLVTLALTYLNPFGKPQAILSKESTEGVETSVSSSNANPNMKRGMVLPFETLSITFDDIRYAVDMPQEMKAQGIEEGRLELLKGVSGAFRPGVLTALMGISGAGKTTLMDVLAGRKTGGYIDGSITISGYPKKQETFARIAGYCEQTDIHSPHVTVFESLQFSAWLRLPPEVDAATRKVLIYI